MRCDAFNGYAGWLVIDVRTGRRIENVLWVDPDAKTFATIDPPPRLIGGEVACITHAAEEIRVNLLSSTFWVKLAPITVAPLSPGRQQDQEPTNKPCADCCQEETCRRTGWCAAHRCGFGDRAP